MAREKREWVKFVTPPGIAKYPRLLEPDYGNEKFPKPAGEFSVKLVYEAGTPGLPELIADLEKVRDEEFEKVANQLAQAKPADQAKVKKAGGLQKAEVYEEELNEESGAPTGRIILKVSMKHTVEYDKGTPKAKVVTRWPEIFDARKRPVKDAKIGGGSTLKVAGIITGWYVASNYKIGASLKLQAVQIINLVEFGTRNADSFGFGEEADGFEAGESEAPAQTANTPASQAPAGAPGGKSGYAF